ncbi:hypothetical protein B0H13DRAFT_764760 [Mycena leptocephala]|nr:hypothetical protein B0H13DRAFT_764760 [Mycena leptocephala]
MRLAPTLVLSSLAGVLVPLVHAHGSFHTSPSRSLARLQHHESRALIDVCVTIPSLVLDVASLIGANLKLCLCIKDLDIYLKTHADVTLQNNAIAEANAAINADGRRKTCGKLPAHAHRACTTADPCAFECDTPYIRQGDQCKCKIAGCGASPTARSLKSRRSTITNWKDAKAICGSLAVCGVKGKPEGWECLDVTDSCGGCPADHPFPKSSVPPGTDCHNIPHSKNVGCEQGKCVVKECFEGYTVSSARDKCIPHHSHRDLITLGGAPAAGSNPMASSLASIIASVNKLLTKPTGSVDVTPVLDSITKLLGSVLDLRVNLNVTITLATSLQSTLTQCGCDPTLLAIVNNLLNSLLSLLDVCRNGVPPIDGTDSCLTVDVSHVVCSLLPGVCIDPIFVCGSLGKLLHDLLQPLLNTLGVGVLPATVCPKCIATLPSGAATLPSATATPPTVPSAVATPSAAPSTAAAHPSDPNIVINIAGITIDLALHISTVASNLDPSSCGDLIAALNDLVKPILGQPLTGPDGLLAGVLRRGLVDLNLNLGGGDSTEANALNSLLQNAHDAVKNAPDSCKAGGLVNDLLSQVVTAVNNLVNGLLGCGCGNAVAGAIAEAQKKAISTPPTITSLVPGPSLPRTPPTSSSTKQRSSLACLSTSIWLVGTCPSRSLSSSS